MSSNLKKLIRREVDTQRQTLVGRVISEMRIADVDGNGSGVFVCQVEIGANRRLIDVPVKSQRGRNFAQLGQTVLLRRNAQGRYEVIGPGDRISTPVEIRTYDLATQVNTGSTDFGFSYQRVPFDFYQTLSVGAPLGVLWGDGVTPFGLVRQVDAQGNPV
ncbi:MAG: hypothetical protein ACRDTJ_00095 [Pseudonocardiaceae bacterium]